MARFQEWLNAAGESNDIAVVAFQLDVISFVFHLDDIDSSDGCSLGADEVEIADNLFLVGDRDIESFQLGCGVQDFCQVFDVWYLEVDVLGINSFVLKFLVEVVS